MDHLSQREDRPRLSLGRLSEFLLGGLARSHGISQMKHRDHVERVARQETGTPLRAAMLQAMKQSVTDTTYSEATRQNIRDALVIFNTTQQETT